MPRGDRTGPRGQGPRTGRGLGNCPTGQTRVSTVQGVGGPQDGRGRGLGRGPQDGRGQGRGRKRGPGRYRINF